MSFIEYNIFATLFLLQILNPLDAICDRKRSDAICVSNLKNAKRVDKGVLVDRPDVKIFLPFRFYVYEPKTLFIPNTYNRYLGMFFKLFGDQLNTYFSD